MKNAVSLLIAAGVVLSSGVASAQLSSRCLQDDVLPFSLAIRRNAWARKCGYITAAKESFLNSVGEYHVFMSACVSFPYAPTTASCTQFAPVSEWEPCLAGFIKLGTCVS